MKQVEKTLKRKPKELENVLDCPKALAHVWLAFCQIKPSVERVGFMDVKAYGELMGSDLTPFDVELIMQLDAELERLANV